MITRVADMTFVGLILISLFFFGSLILIGLVVTFNFVNLVSLVMVGFSILFGLAFGLFAGRWFTKDQLKSLTIKGEWLGADSKKFLYATIVGLFVFLIVSFFILYFNSSVFAGSEVLFTISATFAMYVERMILVSSWERQTKRTIMADWRAFFGRLYVSIE